MPLSVGMSITDRFTTDINCSQIAKPERLMSHRCHANMERSISQDDRYVIAKAITSLLSSKSPVTIPIEENVMPFSVGMLVTDRLTTDINCSPIA
jgi:hypothetical protein